MNGNGDSLQAEPTLSMIRGIVFNIVTPLLVVWLLIGPLAWILRDGLGSDSVASTGINAILKFLMTFYWGPVFTVLIGLTLAFRPRIDHTPKNESI